MLRSSVSDRTTHFSYRDRTFTLTGTASNDHIVRQLRTSRSFYELELLEYLADVARLESDRGVVLDVGANIGNHAVFFGSFLGAHVIAIEPNPAVVPLLEENLTVNHVRHTVHRCAVGATEARGQIVLRDTSNVGAARVEAADAISTDGITISTIDHLLATTPPPGRIWLVKIDVEGSELEVLAGARATLAVHRPHIVIETATPAAHSAIARALAESEYRHVITLGRRATPVAHFAIDPPPWLFAAARLRRLFTAPRSIARAVVREVRATLP